MATENDKRMVLEWLKDTKQDLAADVFSAVCAERDSYREVAVLAKSENDRLFYGRFSTRPEYERKVDAEALALLTKPTEKKETTEK